MLCLLRLALPSSCCELPTRRRLTLANAECRNSALTLAIALATLAIPPLGTGLEPMITPDLLAFVAFALAPKYMMWVRVTLVISALLVFVAFALAALAALAVVAVLAEITFAPLPSFVLVWRQRGWRLRAIEILAALANSPLALAGDASNCRPFPSNCQCLRRLVCWVICG